MEVISSRSLQKAVYRFGISRLDSRTSGLVFMVLSGRRDTRHAYKIM